MQALTFELTAPLLSDAWPPWRRSRRITRGSPPNAKAWDLCRQFPLCPRDEYPVDGHIGPGMRAEARTAALAFPA